ncbi:MAG: hypothetical protein DWH79_12640 [Planctomycetota bacterium]|nr:MAG: hypothetical protein DWH79_12640 [Planctomycetota bacterium]
MPRLRLFGRSSPTGTTTFPWMQAPGTFCGGRWSFPGTVFTAPTACTVAVAVILAGSGRPLPGDETTPPHDPARRSHIQTAGEVAASERLSLAAGLVTSRASEVLREQLGLEGGSGLVVKTVAPGSAAESAGVRRHDVLVALDDQLLVLPEQLSALVSASSPDAPLLLEARRGGRTISISLRQSARKTDAPAASPPLEPSVTAVTAAPVSQPTEPAAPTTVVPPRESAIPAARSAGQPPPNAVRLAADAVLLQDRDYWLKVYRDSETCLMVRDARGWLVFNGPIATPQQRSLIPIRVRERVEQLEAMLDGPMPTDTSETVASPAAAATFAPPPVAIAETSAAAANTPASLATVPQEPVAEIGLLDVAPIEVR